MWKFNRKENLIYNHFKIKGFTDESLENKFEFWNLILSSIILYNEKGNQIELDIPMYFKYRVYRNVFENINKIFVKLINDIEELNDFEYLKLQEKDGFFEIAKNLISLSSIHELNFLEKKINYISFDNSNIKRYLLIKLVNKNKGIFLITIRCY